VKNEVSRNKSNAMIFIGDEPNNINIFTLLLCLSSYIRLSNERPSFHCFPNKIWGYHRSILTLDADWMRLQVARSTCLLSAQGQHLKTDH